MKVAVTGARGFIGRHVLAELATQPVEVVAGVSQSPDCLVEFGQGNVVQVDLQDVASDPFERLGRPDVLIHLAWNGLSDFKSLQHFEEELPRQYRFLSALIRSGLKSLVVTGTCLEYGMQSGPLSEEMEARPCTPYGFAKDVLRRQLEYLKRAHPFALTWARLFYLYGEGQQEKSLFPQLKSAVERHDKVFNMSGGEQLRDYLPVATAARYLVAVALSGKDIGVVNVCSGTPISVRNLVEGWLEANAWAIDLNLGYYPYPDYEPLAFWGSRSKLEKCLELGAVPEVSRLSRTYLKIGCR